MENRQNYEVDHLNYAKKQVKFVYYVWAQDDF